MLRRVFHNPSEGNKEVSKKNIVTQRPSSNFECKVFFLVLGDFENDHNIDREGGSVSGFCYRTSLLIDSLPHLLLKTPLSSQLARLHSRNCHFGIFELSSISLIPFFIQDIQPIFGTVANALLFFIQFLFPLLFW